MIGDVFGKGGGKAVRYLLPKIVDQECVDLTIANVENVSGGIGVSRDAVKGLKEAGVDVMTSGNHVWKKPGVEELFKTEPFLLRPANYPPQSPGRGSVIWESHLGVKVGIINLLGRSRSASVRVPDRWYCTIPSHSEKSPPQSTFCPLSLTMHRDSCFPRMRINRRK